MKPTSLSEPIGRVVPLPERGFTLLPPWPQAILKANKRLENRAPSVARRIGDWRGMVAITQSKTWDDEDADADVRQLRDSKLATLGDLTAVPWAHWAGKLVAVAELLNVFPPHRCENEPWHDAGQWGLILGRVWEVEPVPIMGGRGVWYAGQCPVCDTLQARENRPSPCRKCKATPINEPGPRSAYCWQRPELRIVRECVL